MQTKLAFILFAAMILAAAGCGTQRYNRPLLSAPPSAGADNDVYLADARGGIQAFRSDGSRQWTISLPDEIARLEKSAPHELRIDFLAARSGGKLFGLTTQLTGSDTGATILFALDGNRLLWQLTAPYPSQNGAPIAIGSTAIYEAANDGTLYAFARSDGKQIWKCQVSQGMLGSPTVGADGTVYVTGLNYNLHAIGPDGKQLWVVGTEHQESS